jgi:hypothetical protein
MPGKQPGGVEPEFGGLITAEQLQEFLLVENLDS